ncbi:MAG: hypothetical protein WHT65_04435 [Pseudothermotoga sp.]
MHRVLFLSGKTLISTEKDSVDGQEYNGVDIALDTTVAQRLLLRNSTFYTSIVIDCRGFSEQDLCDFFCLSEKRYLQYFQRSW